MSKYSIPNWTDEDCIITFTLLQVLQLKYVWNILTILCLQWNKWFWELQRGLTPISAKVLSQQLKILIEKEFISKEVIMDWKVKKSIYSLKHKPETFKKLLLVFREYSEGI